MNAVYDHIIAILVVGMIFVGAVVALPTMSFANFQAVDQQQLRNTALNVFNAMLFGTGYPSDWGSRYPFNQSDVKFFGLAIPEESSMYVLDTDKVQRLDVESPGYISYNRVRELLNLKGYGFSLSLFRPFTVDALASVFRENQTHVHVPFAVNVTRNEDGTPIPNAQVRCTIMVTASHSGGKHLGDPIAAVTLPKTFYTNILGSCEANEFVEIPEDYSITDAVAILEISVAGMSTMVVTRASEETIQDFVKIYTFGDIITLRVRDEFNKTGGGERRIRSVSSFSYGGVMGIFDGTESNPPDLHITQGIGYETWEMTFPGLRATNPLLLLFTLRVKNPDRLVIIAGPFSLWDPSEVFSFGPDSEQVSNVAVRLRRYVVISSMTYIAELALWKE